MTNKLNNSGQALVILLIFMIIAVSVTSVAVVTTLTGSTGASKIQEGVLVQELAETGVENARIQLLRNTDYAGEVLTLGGGTVTVTATRSGQSRIITSVGQVGDIKRTISATVSLENGVITVVSWQEIY